MDMYDAKQLYDRLKVSEREDETLDLDARLRAMNGPLLAWYGSMPGSFPEGESGGLPGLDLGNHVAADQGRGGQTYFERFLEALPDVASLASVEG